MIPEHMQELIHTAEEKLKSKELPIVFIALRNDIAPDIRIDHGGGEIGTETTLGVFMTKGSAEEKCKDDLLSDYLVDKKDPELAKMSFEEYEKYRSDYLEYDVEEHQLQR